MEEIQNTTTFLDFEKEKTQPLTLEMLRNTHQEDDIHGNPLRGIYHYQFIDAIQEEAARRQLNVEIYDLFAANNKERMQPGVVLLPKVEATYGPRAIQAHVLRRVFANIRITNYDDDTYTTNFAVAYHQKGIQVALGNNVKICHNQCMLGTKEFFASTYSEKGNGRNSDLPSPAELIPIVGRWLDTVEERVMNERNKIEQMKRVILTTEQIYQLIGILEVQRVACDTRFPQIRTNETYPLNNVQINTFVEDLMLKKVGKDARQEPFTLWDFYDTATNLYKAKSMEIPNIIPQNRAMVNMLESHFQY